MNLLNLHDSFRPVNCTDPAMRSLALNPLRSRPGITASIYVSSPAKERVKK
jgi:hypothetical protein